MKSEQLLENPFFPLKFQKGANDLKILSIKMFKLVLMTAEFDADSKSIYGNAKKLPTTILFTKIV
jgi:hypothetical protein